MKLLAFPKISTRVLHAIAERHNLHARTCSRLPEVGIFNAIYVFGPDVILRIPRNHPAFTAAARKEVVAVPAARAAGVKTPHLIAFDDTLDLLPVPYTLYERIHGAMLGLLDCEPTDTPNVWRAIGHDLALLHTRVADSGAVAEITGDTLPNPRRLLDEIAQDGYVTSMEGRWLMGWLDRLAPAALAPLPRRFLHGDLQTTNVMVRVASHEYLALLDWVVPGGATWRGISRGCRCARRRGCWRAIVLSRHSTTTRRLRRAFCGAIFSWRCSICGAAHERSARGPNGR
jgi:aminoglycoside phosphotransferase (APT) family kinase protein